MKLIYFSKSENEDLYPLLVGHYACPKNNSYGPHVREYCLIHFVLKGKGVLINDRGTHPVSAGQMFIIRKNEVTTYVADGDDPWEYTWIAFFGNRVALFDDTNDVIKTPADIDMKLLEYVKHYDKSPDIFTSILYELVYHLFTSRDNVSQNERIRRIHSYIKYNYMEDITVEKLADEFGFERSYLYRMFKQRYGISPKEYLTRIRLTKAKEFLSQGYSIAECAYIIGYADAFSLSRAYKKYYGVSPSHDKHR